MNSHIPTENQWIYFIPFIINFSKCDWSAETKFDFQNLWNILIYGIVLLSNNNWEIEICIDSNVFWGTENESGNGKWIAPFCHILPFLRSLPQWVELWVHEKTRCMWMSMFFGMQKTNLVMENICTLYTPHITPLQSLIWGFKFEVWCRKAP